MHRPNRKERINRAKRKTRMANVTSVDVKFDDGTVQTVNAAPVVAPSDTEVDIVMSDGSVKKFVPAA